MRTGQSSGAVTTDSVITSLMSTSATLRLLIHTLLAVAPPTPTQLAWRGRIEALIRLAQPALDLVLAAGERVSRMAEPEDLDWTQPRPVSPPATPARVGPGPGGAEPHVR